MSPKPSTTGLCDHHTDTHNVSMKFEASWSRNWANFTAMILLLRTILIRLSLCEASYKNIISLKTSDKKILAVAVAFLPPIFWSEKADCIKKSLWGSKFQDKKQFFPQKAFTHPKVRVIFQGLWLSHRCGTRREMPQVPWPWPWWATGVPLPAWLAPTCPAGRGPHQPT